MLYQLSYRGPPVSINMYLVSLLSVLVPLLVQSDDYFLKLSLYSPLGGLDTQLLSEHGNISLHTIFILFRSTIVSTKPGLLLVKMMVGVMLVLHVVSIVLEQLHIMAKYSMYTPLFTV